MKPFGPSSCDSVAAGQSADKAAHSQELNSLMGVQFTYSRLFQYLHLTLFADVV